MPDRPILVLSNGYSLDFSQVSRICAYVQRAGEGQGIPSRAQLAAAIGSSERRMEGLLKCAAAMGVIDTAQLALTPLGKLVAAFDQYFDDLGTLWLLHYLIGSKPQLYVWGRMVNTVVPGARAFSFAEAKAAFSDAPTLYPGSRVMRRVQKELSTFLNAYTQQHFARLRYLREESRHAYVTGPQEPIPALVFASAVLCSRDDFWPGAATLDIARLASEANSPGRVFNLTERQVRDLLEEAEGLGYLYVETRADLDQVRFRDDHHYLDALRRYYEER